MQSIKSGNIIEAALSLFAGDSSPNTSFRILILLFVGDGKGQNDLQRDDFFFLNLKSRGHCDSKKCNTHIGLPERDWHVLYSIRCVEVNFM